VLLVLLIVYLAVPKSPDTDVAQETELTEGQPADGEQSPADGSSDPADAVPSDAGSTGAQVAGAEQRETPAGRDPFAPNAGGSDAQATAGAGEGTNWAKLLETGEMPLRTMTPSLSASRTEPPAAGGAPAAQEPAAPSDALAQAASDVTSGSASTAAPTTTNSDAESTRTSAKTSDAPSNRATSAGGNARTHRVAKGETFAKIAETLLGDERYYLEIEKANPDIDPTRIRPGMVINLPDVSTAKRSSGSSSSNDAAVTASGRQERELDPEKEYKVRPGDSLYIIAKRVYHNSAKMDEIYELNKGVIGDDPAKVRAGMVLKLPPKGESESSESR
jgi:nucleoid-associated protein YgaU